jgi:hypothetical protein
MTLDGTGHESNQSVLFEISGLGYVHVSGTHLAGLCLAKMKLFGDS